MLTGSTLQRVSTVSWLSSWLDGSFWDSNSVILIFAFGHNPPKLNACLKLQSTSPIMVDRLVNMPMVTAYCTDTNTPQLMMAKSTLPSFYPETPMTNHGILPSCSSSPSNSCQQSTTIVNVTTRQTIA